MISSISSSRLWPQQVAFKAFNDTSGNPENPTPGSSAASLSRLFYSEAADEVDDYGYESELSSLFGSLSQTTAGNSPDQDTDVAIDDISSNAFMKALQQKIDTLKASADTSGMAETMQAALAAGRLTVTDVVTGEEIIARDIANADTTSGEVTSITTSEWSSFLRDTLLRDSYGRYVRNDDSSHIDKASGKSAYFGMIGETHYYLSWTSAANT
ncbi:hypothetical protein [Aliirhizobium smilacinae]|uniref:Uncharacterized protein n=1 Tax=Aliirhizobium smilacinae TaxID=1395944 RepID=A0A5C4XQF1_9HYPH|nr:hypothetical protein [Rhizobium smilacinae]TNM65548.1 hypothetical protein FHP24_04590 [Rhizobium smilacinae]